MTGYSEGESGKRSSHRPADESLRRGEQDADRSGAEFEACPHTAVRLLSRHEIIRKYQCEDCGAVNACSCDESFARQFLPHQIDWAMDDETGLRVPSGGFAVGLCNECRGLAPVPSPRADGYRAGGKVERYYWREIHMEWHRRLHSWCVAHGYERNSRERPVIEQSGIIRRAVVDETRVAAAAAPKYDMTERSAADVLVEAGVETIAMQGTYVANAEQATVLRDGETIDVEEYVRRELEDEGWSVIRCESRPFHALYGCLMWLWVQDPADPLNRVVVFGGRDGAETDSSGRVWTHLPEDFGHPNHVRRRAAALEEHLQDLLPDDTDELLWLFDYWLEPSSGLRAYLWAHDEDVTRSAIAIVQVIGAVVTKRILRFLAEDYWGRYVGWPDFLVHRESDWFLAEVKSSRDRLSGAQKDWFDANGKYLGLPAKVIKVHRAKTA